MILRNIICLSLLLSIVTLMSSTILKANCKFNLYSKSFKLITLLIHNKKNKKRITYSCNSIIRITKKTNDYKVKMNDKKLYKLLLESGF